MIQASRLKRRRPQRCEVRKTPGLREYFMLDIIMLALGLGFFVLAIGYGYACERL
jgi:hypothetical protein